MARDCLAQEPISRTLRAARASVGCALASGPGAEGQSPPEEPLSPPGNAGLLTETTSERLTANPSRISPR